MTLVRSLNPATGETEVSEIRDRTLPGSAFQPGAPGGGLPILTTTARNALTGGYLYRGLTILNATTGAVEVYYGAVTGWRPPWNVAWGNLATVNRTTSVAGSTTLTVQVIASPTIVVPANRLLAIAYGSAAVAASAQQYTYILRRNAGGTTIQSFNISVPVSSGTPVSDLSLSFTESPPAGSISYDFAGLAAPVAWTDQGSASFIAQMTVVDVGPNGSAPAS